MLAKELLKLNTEILRSKEMDYYKYHSFLNHINEVFEKFIDNQSEESKEVVLGISREIIQRFVDTYGVKKVPSQVRDTAQDIIINHEWNFN